MTHKSRSRRETESEVGVSERGSVDSKLHAVDPKPSDLSMARLKRR